MKQVYVILCHSGSYSDYSCLPLKAFSSEVDAERYIAFLQEFAEIIRETYLQAEKEIPFTYTTEPLVKKSYPSELRDAQLLPKGSSLFTPRLKQMQKDWAEYCQEFNTAESLQRQAYWNAQEACGAERLKLQNQMIADTKFAEFHQQKHNGCKTAISSYNAGCNYTIEELEFD